MLKEMAQIMDQARAARDRLTCDKGHFHPHMEPHHWTLIIATLVARLDELKGWQDSGNRDMAVELMGHLLDIVGNYLEDDLQPQMDIDELESLLRTDTVSCGLIVRALGKQIEIVDSDGSGPEQRVVH